MVPGTVSFKQVPQNNKAGIDSALLFNMIGSHKHMKTKHNYMKTGIIKTTLLPVILLLTFSCGDNHKPDKSLLIPEDALVNILTDTYLTDGLMDLPSVRKMYYYRDSTANYDDILRQYGYSMNQMDSTLRYYFLYKPKKMEKIYDRVTGKLLEMEANLVGETSTGDASGKTNLCHGQQQQSRQESKRVGIDFLFHYFSFCSV